MFEIHGFLPIVFEELFIMKKILLLTLCAIASVILLTSCASGSINVQVIDGEGNVICNEDVQLGEENETSIEGVTFYGIDCLEAALRQAGIEYYIDKADYESYALTNVGDIACDKEFGFKYYVKSTADKDYVDKSGLTAQHDEIARGDKLMFKFESLAEAE